MEPLKTQKKIKTLLFTALHSKMSTTLWQEKDEIESISTATVAKSLELPPCEWEVVGSIPGCDKTKIFITGCSGYPT